jgi:hypothetical protein
MSEPASEFEWDDQLRSWIVKRTEHWIVSVTPMMFNDRVCLTSHREYPRTYTAGWCYDKNGSAFLAAYAFDPETEHAPVGFKKVAADARTLTE